MGSRTSQQYWSDHWHGKEFSIAPQHHPVRQWIESEVTQSATADVFEVGCYPGKFLAVFGERGYSLNGIDSFSEMNSEMQKWLENEGYKIGQFYQSDFCHFISPKKYDIVCSFGFIEHFKSWEIALVKHVELAKDGGQIMIDVPNLKSPLYYWLYKIFEPTVLKNHVLSMLDKNVICDVFEKKGCVVKTAKYLGHFYFRFVTRHDKFSIAIAKCINFFRPIFELLPRPVHARYIAISAVKNDSRVSWQ